MDADLLEGLYRKARAFSPSPGKNPDYYTQVLDYMEENGVRAYGCYVIASPQTLLKIMGEGVMSHISLLDARIGI